MKRELTTGLQGHPKSAGDFSEERPVCLLAGVTASKSGQKKHRDKAVTDGGLEGIGGN